MLFGLLCHRWGTLIGITLSPIGGRRGGVAMNATAEIFAVERLGNTLILTPQMDLGELHFWEIEEKGRDLVRMLADPSIRVIVMDFANTGYFGSSALGLLTRLWRMMRDRGGKMALCNVSTNELEILDVVGLGGLWPVYPSREEAVEAVAG